ncbi:MAG: hypothetical protein U0R44_00685 [Candidatus Micrarchaeia archaeon]
MESISRSFNSRSSIEEILQDLSSSLPDLRWMMRESHNEGDYIEGRGGDRILVRIHDWCNAPFTQRPARCFQISLRLPEGKTGPLISKMLEIAGATDIVEDEPYFE